MTEQRRRWNAFWSRAGARGEPGPHFEALDACYSGPQRAWHGWRHILECLDLLEGSRGGCEDSVAVELALWHHDAVYDPRAADNEERSASLARIAGEAMGLAAGTVDRACNLVLATAHLGRKPPAAGGGADAPLVLDIDLAILGSPPADFQVYEEAIRAEYSFLAAAEYSEGRSAVLRSFQERPRIYLTDRFFGELEARARLNIAESLARLSRQEM